jgi:hypothetical protein
MLYWFVMHDHVDKIQGEKQKHEPVLFGQGTCSGAFSFSFTTVHTRAEPAISRHGLLRRGTPEIMYEEEQQWWSLRGC